MTDEIEVLVGRLHAANPSGDGPTTLEDEAADALSSLSRRVKELEEGLGRLTDAITTVRLSHSEEHLVVAYADLDDADERARALLQKDKA